MKKVKNKIFIMVIIIIIIILFIIISIKNQNIPLYINEGSVNNNVMNSKVDNDDIMISNWNETLLEKEKFSNRELYPTQEQKDNAPKIYEDNNLILYDINDLTTYGPAYTEDGIILNQGFNLLIEYKNSSFEVETDNFVYRLNNNDYYYSSGIESTFKGFLDDNNLEYLIFNVEGKKDDELTNIYYNDDGNLYELTSNLIAKKIEYTNTSIENDESVVISEK